MMETAIKKRLYSIWNNMRQRCNNHKRADFKYYGGKGVSVCAEWDDFRNFAKWAIQSGYQNTLTIDRLNLDGNYEPSNCRWIPFEKQRENTTQSRMVSIAGKTQNLKAWCGELGINYYTICQRIHRGMDVKDALIVPIKEAK